MFWICEQFWIGGTCGLSEVDRCGQIAELVSGGLVGLFGC